MEPEFSLPCPQNPVICPCPNPDASNPVLFIFNGVWISFHVKQSHTCPKFTGYVYQSFVPISRISCYFLRPSLPAKIILISLPLFSFLQLITLFTRLFTVQTAMLWLWGWENCFSLSPSTRRNVNFADSIIRLQKTLQTCNSIAHYLHILLLMLSITPLAAVYLKTLIFDVV